MRKSLKMYLQGILESEWKVALDHGGFPCISDHKYNIQFKPYETSDEEAHYGKKQVIAKNCS